MCIRDRREGPQTGIDARVQRQGEVPQGAAAEELAEVDGDRDLHRLGPPPLGLLQIDDDLGHDGGEERRDCHVIAVGGVQQVLGRDDAADQVQEAVGLRGAPEAVGVGLGAAQGLSAGMALEAVLQLLRGCGLPPVQDTVLWRDGEDVYKRQRPARSS